MFEALPKESPAKMAIDGVFASFATSPAGLSDLEAKARHARFGANELAAKRVTARDVLLRQFASPLIYLLAAAAAVSLSLRQWIDGLTIAAMLLVNAGIGFFQEYRSEQAVEKLREKLAPRARVRRDGTVMTIDRKRLVPGDVLIFGPGDIVPADARVTVSRRLTLDESTLSGEANAVSKTAELDPAAVAGRAANMCYMLTRVIAGYGEGVVATVGAGTVIGGIAKLTVETPRVSAFERSIQSFSSFLLKTILIVLGGVFAVNVLLKGESQIVPQFLFAAALAVSVVPEALPAITSLTLSRGAMRLAKRHVVVKRLSAIEDLGHIEILCTDKTGTLTQGVMKVDAVTGPDPQRLLQWALGVAAEDDLQRPSHTPKTFDAAVIAKAGEAAAKAALGWKRLWFTPFDPSRRRATAVFDDGHGPMLAVLGAPEAVLARSTRRLTKDGERHLDPTEGLAEKEEVRKDGVAGRRVLALGFKRIASKHAYDDEDEKGLTYVGRIAFVDPLKASAKQSVAEAKQLRVRVKILTGDSPEVAGAIGVQTGVLSRAEDVVTGETLDAASDGAFDRLIAERDVFARVTPEQKFRIVQALEREFQVAFLGEGINDAPALKAANVALAVDGASDVAREAADIILLKKDLRVIVDGVRQGREIFTNVIKYVKYTLIGNFGNFLAIAGVSILIDELPMLPVQILLTNLLTDLPLVSVAGDTVDAAEVVGPKRFNLRELAFIGLLLGLVSSFFDFAFFALNRRLGLPAVRTLWFLFSVVTELGLIYSIRTRGPFWRAVRPSRALVGFSLATVALALWLTATVFGADVFRFVKPTFAQLGIVLALGAAYFAVTEAVKLLYGKVFKPSANGV